MASERGVMIGRHLIQRLQQVGVKHVFGVPGDYVLDLMDRLVESSIELVGTCNELNAGYAADAYARLNGIGAVMVTYGVGAFSLLNAVAGAYAERVPLVVISGAPHSAHRKIHAPMHHLARDYRLQLDIFTKITVCAVMLTEPETACGEVDRALEACLRHKRPVYIEVPVDMVSKPAGVVPADMAMSERPASDAAALNESLAEATAMLAAANHPAILAGVEIHRFGLRDQVVRLLDKCGFSVATTVNGKTAIPEEHPQFIGIYEGAVSRDQVREAIESADCLLSLGAWFTDIATGGFTAKLDENRMIAANSDCVKIKHHHYDNVYLGDFVSGLIETIQPAAPGRRHASDAPHVTQAAYHPRPKEPITVSRFFERLNHFLDDQMVLIAGTGDTMFGAAELHTNKPESFLAQANYLSIGYALPAGLGAGLAAPAKRAVICIGDGAFQMTGQCLSTLIRYRTAPIVFLLNNDGYATERAIHDGPYNEIQSWKYHQLPVVFGGDMGLEVRTEGDLQRALETANRHRDRMVFIEVVVDRTDHTEALGRIAVAIRKTHSPPTGP